MHRFLICGLAFFLLGCSGEKATSLNAGAGKNMSSSESLYRQGTAVLESDPNAAVELLTRSLAASPNAPPAIYNRAVAYARIGRDAEAVADVRRLEELEPEIGAQLRMKLALSAAPYVDIAQTEFASGNFEKALAKYESALAYNPTYVDAWIGKANVLDKLNRSGEAANARRRAEELKQSSDRN